jgi:putative inorganic carbon (hco3(-)) transporter
MKLTRFFAIVILLSAAVGQLNRIFLGDGEGAVLYVNDLLVGVMAALYLIYVLIVRKSWKIPPTMFGIWLFLVFGGLGLLLNSLVLSGSELLISLSYLIRYLCYSFLFFVTYDALMYAPDEQRAEEQLERWVMWIIVTCALVALSGFVQLYVLPDLGALARYGWDPHLNRLTTAMLDPNYAAAYLSIGAALAISLYLHSKNPRLQLTMLGVIALLLAAILLTYSRSGYLMLAIVLGVISITKSRWLLIVGAVLAIMAFTFIPRVQQRVVGAFEVDASASPRIVSWQNSLNIGLDNQPLGVGYNSYRYAQDRYGILNLEESGNAGAGADSSWLFIFATSGILGLFAFLFCYVGLAWSSLQGYLRAKSEIAKGTCLAFLAVITGLAIFTQFNNALFYTWILELFWVIGGLVAAIHQRLGIPSSPFKD